MLWGVVGSGKQAIELCAELQPDIVLVDLQMTSETDGIFAISQITKMFADIKCIAFTIHEEDEYLFQAYAAGAIDYIIKTDSIIKVIKSIHDVYENKLAMRPDIAKKVLEEFSRLKNDRNSMINSLNLLSKLTNSELEILHALYYGSTYSQLARERFVEEVTIRTQITHILRKFGKRRMKEVFKPIKGSKTLRNVRFLKQILIRRTHEFFPTH